MTAYSEAAWGPNKGLNNGKDMQWGGGSLFVNKQEKDDEKTGKHFFLFSFLLYNTSYLLVLGWLTS